MPPATAKQSSIDAVDALVASLRRERPWLVAAVLVALIVHSAVAVALPQLFHSPAPGAALAPSVTEVIDIEQPLPPPPRSEPKPPEPPEPARAAAVPLPTNTPPPPAQAAAVLTKEATPNEPVDLTDSIVTGSAATFAGGTSSTNGTGDRAVHGPVVVGAVPAAASPSTPRSTGPDRSRRPALAGGAHWSCPFPPEADGDQIDSAVVTIRVLVDPSGTPKSANVLSDPGHGFGREATRCALSKSWSSALDHDGAPTEGTVVVNVRFDR